MTGQARVRRDGGIEVGNRDADVVDLVEVAQRQDSSGHFTGTRVVHSVSSCDALV